MNKILLIGANLRATLFVAKNLYKNGYIIDVVDFEDIPLKKLKYINTYFKIDETNNPVFLQNQIIKIISSAQYKCIIPINDVGILICHKYFEQIENYCKIIMPNKEEIKFTIDKFNIIKKSLEFGFNYLKTLYISSYEELIIKIPNVDYFPVVVRSNSSKKIINNEIKSFSAFLATNKDELLNRINYEYFPIIIQNQINTEEIGFNFLAVKGEIIISYFDKKILGNFGEECISRQVINRNIELENKFKDLIKSISYNGVGMFDVFQENNNYYILELNGRFWASIDLSEKAKTNLMQSYIEYFIKGNENICKSDGNYKIITNVNLFALIKSIIQKDLKIKSLKLLVKSLFNKNYYIQENIIRDFRFYCCMCLNKLKKNFLSKCKAKSCQSVK